MWTKLSDIEVFFLNENPQNMYILNLKANYHDKINFDPNFHVLEEHMVVGTNGYL